MEKPSEDHYCFPQDGLWPDLQQYCSFLHITENGKSSLLALGQRDFYLAPSSGRCQPQALWCSRFPQQPLPHPIYLYNPPLGRQMESSQPGIFESVVAVVVVVGLFLLWELHALISCYKYESRDEGESCEMSSEVFIHVAILLFQQKTNIQAMGLVWVGATGYLGW